MGADSTADEMSGATRLVVDMRVASLLAGEARRQVVTRVFGVPPEAQSFMTTVILFGAAGAVVRGAVARPLPHPSRGDALIGAGVLNTALGGLAGPAAAGVPLAGGLIAFAVVAHALRPAVTGSLRSGRALTRATWGTLDHRYVHHARSVVAGGAA